MIKVNGLTVKYPNGLEALREVTITIPSDKITCVLGPNGAGKTTLLKAIARMIDYKGTILLNGIEVSKQPIKTIARMIAYATQLYVHELLSLTVEEALIIARYPVSSGFFESEADYKVIHNVARELVIEEFLKRRLSELSSGELQRVVLAIALVKNPKILLFDELDAHVDIGVKTILAKLIHKWARNRILVFTTHDILFGSSIGEYFIVLDKGRVVYKGDLKGLIINVDMLEKIYGVKIHVTSVNGKYLLIPRYI